MIKRGQLSLFIKREIFVRRGDHHEAPCYTENFFNSFNRIRDVLDNMIQYDKVEGVIAKHRKAFFIQIT